MDEYEETFGVKVCNIQNKSDSGERCKHLNMEQDENGLHVCPDCGVEKEIFDYEPEWRHYQDQQGKDPIRCHFVYTDQNTLDKVFEKLQIRIEEKIKTQIEAKYRVIIAGTTTRGRGRLAVIAACLFIVYKTMGATKPNEQIRNMFGLSKKSLTEGLSIYYQFFPQERTKITKAHDLIPSCISQTKNISPDLSPEISQFTSVIEDKSVQLLRSCPQAIAAACILFYVSTVKKQQIHRATFANCVGLSEITITRLYKEIARIIKHFEIKDGFTRLK